MNPKVDKVLKNFKKSNKKRLKATPKIKAMEKDLLLKVDRLQVESAVKEK